MSLLPHRKKLGEFSADHCSTLCGSKLSHRGIAVTDRVAHWQAAMPKRSASGAPQSHSLKREATAAARRRRRPVKAFVMARSPSARSYPKTFVTGRTIRGKD